MASTSSLSSESVVSVTIDREAHPERWVASLVQICMEKKVGERLKRLSIENYVPTQTEIHQWIDRKKKVECVVIPMVVFIRTDEATECELRMQSFIHKFLAYSGQTAADVIPDEQIDRLMFMLKQANAPIELMPANLCRRWGTHCA